MSTTEDDNPNETIDECGKKRYRSKYHAKIVAEQNEVKKDHQTMGCANAGQPDPEHFLKQKPHDVWPPHKCTDFKRDHKLPPIPKPIRPEDFPERNQTDFIRQNICAVTNPVNVGGDGDGAEVLPAPTKKPCGCEKCKIEAEQQVRRQRSTLTSQKSRCSLLSSSASVASLCCPKDRHNTNCNNLTILKSKRDSLMREFLGLPLLTDTITRIQRKSRLERLLDDYEKRIATIEYQ